VGEIFRGEIEFKDVFFRYPHQTDHALQGFSLLVKPHERISIVGPSGSGKSTLLLLLAGFYSPESGSVMIDGYSLENIEVKSLRSNLGFVSQRVTLFSGSIRENIRLGNDTATDAELMAAAEAAYVTEFSEKLPMGLDTPLGSLGGRRTIRKKQRIAIARAFLKNAPILLLDEATSALDRDSERAVLESLERLMVGRTVLMVSHSPERLLGMSRTVSLYQSSACP